GVDRAGGHPGQEDGDDLPGGHRRRLPTPVKGDPPGVDTSTVTSVLRRFGVLTLVSALVVLPLGPAYADGAAQAKADAHQSEVRLHRLQARLHTALARYDTALGSLQDQVSAGVRADDATRASDAALLAAQ